MKDHLFVFSFDILQTYNKGHCLAHVDFEPTIYVTELRLRTSRGLVTVDEKQIRFFGDRMHQKLLLRFSIEHEKPLPFTGTLQL